MLPLKILKFLIDSYELPLFSTKNHAFLINFRLKLWFFANTRWTPNCLKKAVTETVHVMRTNKWPIFSWNRPFWETWISSQKSRSKQLILYHFSENSFFDEKLWYSKMNIAVWDLRFCQYLCSMFMFRSNMKIPKFPILKIWKL